MAITGISTVCRCLNPSDLDKSVNCHFGTLVASLRPQIFLKMRIHGNYCGPNWSAGKHQESVVDSSVPAVDEFDETCLLHDASYATGSDLVAADFKFAKANLGKGIVRTIAGAAVGAQGLGRVIGGPHITMPKLRGTKAAKKQASTTLTTVPASYGFSLRMQAPSVSRSGNKATIVGADFASTVRTANSASYQPAASVLLNPAYFQNAMLGSLARTFEKFRFTKVHVQYIPAVPTSTQGQLVLCSSRSVKEPFFDGASTTFLSKALSQGNALATPLWKEASLDVPCGGEWLLVNPLIDADLDDCIQEEVQAYSTCDSSLSAGILLLHYTIEFKDPLYTYHPTMIPVPMGNGSFGTLNDNSAINAVNDAIRLWTPNGLVFNDTGSVYRLVFRQEASAVPTGPLSWASVAVVASTNPANATSVTVGATTIRMQTGTVLYGLYDGLNLTLYASYDGAMAGTPNDVLVYQTATTAVGLWSFAACLVRMGPALRVTSQ